MNLRAALLGNGQTTFANLNVAQSAEEEFVAMQVANESLAECEQIRSEVERLADIAFGLEGLVEVCSHITEAKSTDVCLVESAVELALAGTGVRTDEVVTGLESSVGRTIAVESVVSTIKNIWESIKKMVKKMWSKVKTFFASVFQAIPRLRKAAEGVKTRANGCMGKTSEESKVEMGRLAAVFCRGPKYDVIKDTATVVKTLNDYVKISSDVFEEIPKSTLVLGTAIKDDISAYDHMHGSMPKVKATEPKFDFEGGVNVTGRFDSDNRYTGLKIVSAVDVLAGRSIVFAAAVNKKDGSGVGEMLPVTNTRMQIVMAAADSEVDLPEDGEMALLTPAQCIELADDLISICDIMSTFTGGKTFKKIEETSSKIKEAIEKKTASAAKITDDSYDNEMRDHFRVVVGLHGFWSGFATQLPQQMQGHMMLVGRGVVELCNKSLSLYK